MTLPHAMRLTDVVGHFLQNRLLAMDGDQRAYKAGGEMFYEVGVIRTGRVIRGPLNVFQRRIERVLRRTYLRLRRNAPAERFRVSIQGPVIEDPRDYRELVFALVAGEVETPMRPSPMEVNL